MENNPAEKCRYLPIIQSCSSKSRPVSKQRKMSNNGNSHSYKVEINLTRILSIKRKNSKTTTEQPVLHHFSYSNVLRLCTNKSPTSSAFIGDKGNCSHAIENCKSVNTPPNGTDIIGLPCTFSMQQGDLNGEIDEKSDKSMNNEIQYKKTVAKRWRKNRDNAIQQGVLFGIESDQDILAKFNHLTNNVPYLCSVGFQDCVNNRSGLLLKKEQQVFLSRKAFKPFFNERYGIMPSRSPCEAYIILPKTGNELTIVKIVEKKAQTQNEGSFEHKIWSSLYLKKEFEITLGEHFRIEYAICLNNVLESQYKNLNLSKIKVIQTLLLENNVSMFFGEHKDYLKQLNSWTGCK